MKSNPLRSQVALAGIFAAFLAHPGAYSHATPVCSADVDCTDDNECTADVCDGGVCTHPNLPVETPCTPAGVDCREDICDGNGACTHPPVPSGTPCSSDGNACTNDTCFGGTCFHRGLPDPSCRTPFKPGKATLLIQHDADPKKDKLDWKWAGGSATDVSALGDPIGATDWQLCVFDRVLLNGTIEFRSDVAHGGVCGTPEKPMPCWAVKGKAPDVKGYKFSDKTLLQHGTRTIDLAAGIDGKAKVSFQAKGPNLMPPALPLNDRVVVQLHASNGECWSASYAAPTKNTSTVYKAKAD